MVCAMVVGSPSLNLALGSGIAVLLIASVKADSAHPMVIDAPLSRAVAPSAPIDNVHQVRRSPDGLFHIEAYVNGAPVRFVVDTGATVLVLSRQDADRLKIAADDERAADHIRTASGAAPMRWSSVDRMGVAGRQLRNIDVAVPDGQGGVSLMGLSVLSQLGPITLEGDQLTIG